VKKIAVKPTKRRTDWYKDSDLDYSISDTIGGGVGDLKDRLGKVAEAEADKFGKRLEREIIRAIEATCKQEAQLWLNPRRKKPGDPTSRTPPRSLELDLKISIPFNEPGYSPSWTVPLEELFDFEVWMGEGSDSPNWLIFMRDYLRRAADRFDKAAANWKPEEQ
jgi:hypothetical protein